MSAAPAPTRAARLLSGGNIQKLILARVLDRKPRLVLANQPTRGLDIGAQTEVHRRLLAAREAGVGVILISEDLDELTALSDRIAVMTGGRLSETHGRRHPRSRHARPDDGRPPRRRKRHDPLRAPPDRLAGCSPSPRRSPPASSALALAAIPLAFAGAPIVDGLSA